MDEPFSYCNYQSRGHETKGNIRSSWGHVHGGSGAKQINILHFQRLHCFRWLHCCTAAAIRYIKGRGATYGSGGIQYVFSRPKFRAPSGMPFSAYYLGRYVLCEGTDLDEVLLCVTLSDAETRVPFHSTFQEVNWLLNWYTLYWERSS